MREALVEPVLDLDLDRVLVRHDDRFIEVLEKPMSWDDLVWGCVFVVGVSGLFGMATTPFSLATVLIGPFVLLFAALGGYALLQRLRRSAMRIDRETWKVEGAGSKRSFDGPPTAMASTSLYFAGGRPKRHWCHSQPWRQEPGDRQRARPPRAGRGGRRLPEPPDSR